MRRALSLTAVILAACAQPQLIAKPADGYRAFRLTETVRLPRGVHFNEYSAGTVLLGDATLSGQLTFCGPVAQGVDARSCFSEAQLGQRFPPGALEEIRVR